MTGKALGRGGLYLNRGPVTPARHVIVHATSGETVQFPAGLLVRSVTEAGVDRHFVLLCDSNNKCVSLERIAR